MGEASHPNNRRAAIAEVVLRELYIEKRLTLAQAAWHFGVAPITVRRRLGDLGIVARPRGPSQMFGTAQVRTTWSADVAYAVGVIATDGNLSRDGRHLAVSSKDVDLLEAVRRCLRLTASITPCSGTKCFHIQWGDRVFYDWLLAIGLMPAKSLALGRIAVPDDVFRDFLRGCIDGDGSIVTYVDRHNTPKRDTYVYDRLFVSLVSASSTFLPWIQSTVLRLHGLKGHLTVRRVPERNAIWCLRYAKRDSVRLLRWLYYAPDLPALQRKRERAERATARATWYRHSLSDRID
jgi:hypothetical protein